jgi:hypothetical protein
MIGLLALGGLALAQTVQRALEIVVNGQKSSAKAIVVQGKTYIPLDVMKSLGVNASVTGNSVSLGAQGGANQVAALEGCVNETLFNGVMRLKVLKFERLETLPKWEGVKGWAVTTEVRNASPMTISPGDLGVYGATLALKDGTIIDIGKISATSREFYGDISNGLPSGGATTLVIRFGDFDSLNDNAPTKLVLTVDPKRAKREVQGRFSGSDVSFRVKLDCTK